MTAATWIADNGVALGSTPALAGGLTFELDASDGQSVFLSVVPEAGTGALAGLGLLLLVLRLRNK